MSPRPSIAPQRQASTACPARGDVKPPSSWAAARLNGSNLLPQEIKSAGHEGKAHWGRARAVTNPGAGLVPRRPRPHGRGRDARRRLPRRHRRVAVAQRPHRAARDGRPRAASARPRTTSWSRSSPGSTRCCRPRSCAPRCAAHTAAAPTVDVLAGVSGLTNPVVGIE
jgi:hypothetical protein